MPRWSAGRRSVLVLGALLVLVTAAAAATYAGLYNIAADVPHPQPVYWLFETVRERSVAARARDIVVPNDLADTNRISKGAGEYAEMCSGCHLAPGMKRTEISRGLYPRAPELRRKTDLTPAEQFWIVKHGLKMTGMPAWGVTHEDELLWDLVAFVRKLPELTPEQYETMMKTAPKHEELMHEMETGSDHEHSAEGGTFKVGPLTVENPWSRATPGGAKVAVGYLTIKNDGATADRLISATAAIAGSTEIHLMSMDNGVMKMRPMADGVSIPANASVNFEPNSYHLMFMELTKPLEKGEQFPATLTFDHAGKVDVMFDVEAIGATAPEK